MKKNILIIAVCVALLISIQYLMSHSSSIKDEYVSNKNNVQTNSKENEKMKFWNTQRKGTNFFNTKPIPQNYEIAKEKGIEFVRLVPSKWTKGKRDFLIGDVTDYNGLVKEDVDSLLKDLDAADKAGMKVIVSTLSIPGLRYVQFNDGKIDLRIWKDKKYIEQTAQFWRDLAKVLKDHPAVVGYNIINEPQPERLSTKGEFWDLDFDKWYKSIENTSQDLNLLYSEVTEEIRKVDKDTPIVLDSGLYATPWAFKYLKKQNDENTIYSFHMYEPYGYTTKSLNNGKYSYPGKLPTTEGNLEEWNSKTMNKFFDPVREFQKNNNIAENRILVGEFGCNRNTDGIEAYFEDMINVYNKENWSWAFYSFREDEWDAMDYELGKGAPDWRYWEAIENGENPPESCRKKNTIWDVIEKQLKN
ncbi:glycoside hydrolase family 5 protein [Tepidibacter hydrothermalis]|uniref:Cellulase family glycosylhydrolase n=1 Tax=Tepidibacter hydrothermalis TaxID=3036126 RepID=A0ABY8EE14_9FIRM|nr:cellulase family glycosylhydrolase [Tepidibacter hydrothermalis]WFD11186.1 cellulase family glycosylhydrolase [Tepidibacter hydrothermalis]